MAKNQSALEGKKKIGERFSLVEARAAVDPDWLGGSLPSNPPSHSNRHLFVCNLNLISPHPTVDSLEPVDPNLCVCCITSAILRVQAGRQFRKKKKKNYRRMQRILRVEVVGCMVRYYTAALPCARYGGTVQLANFPRGILILLSSTNQQDDIMDRRVSLVLVYIYTDNCCRGW